MECYHILIFPRDAERKHTHTQYGEQCHDRFAITMVITETIAAVGRQETREDNLVA